MTLLENRFVSSTASFTKISFRIDMSGILKPKNNEAKKPHWVTDLKRTMEEYPIRINTLTAQLENCEAAHIAQGAITNAQSAQVKIKRKVRN